MKLDFQGRTALLRGLEFWRRGAAVLPLVIILLAAFGVTAQTTNTLSDAEIQGRQLAQQLCETRPVENFTNTGVLRIRDQTGKSSEVPLICKAFLTIDSTSWSAIYETVIDVTQTNDILSVIHKSGQPNQYYYWKYETTKLRLEGFLSANETMIPFDGSDFWICDLGLEFLHWPGQKILRGDTARGRLCKVLESTNPNPSPNGYSRVLCWIDNEALGIVEAKAYDAQGKLLKEFYPKDIKKVDGQWQVGSMEIDNVQTGSRTRLEFDLNAK
jgi:hypothetical protein